MRDSIGATKSALLLLALYVGVSVFNALNAPDAVWQYLYSETGPYEYFSPWLWLLLGGLVICSSAFKPSLRISASLAALLMAARELDMHKALFSTSFIKTNFYKSATIPVQDKILGGILLLAIVALTLYLLVSFVKQLKTKGIKNGPTALLVSALGLGALSKIFDRLSSKLFSEFQIVVPENIDRIVVSLEESIEMAVPVLMIVALFSLQQRLSKP